ncbi:MAG: ABC transporter ATP-binding protein [Desulfobacteraceae bacterium]|nr:ABC transporter ATP-binding protein [Desulfobacteraceae bacterium]
MITIENLNFGYTQKALFSRLDLTLEAGNICGLLGKNGAGKTTLLKIMAGLLFPQNGRAEVMGYVPGNRRPEFLREVILLPEEFHLPSVTASDYVSLHSPFYPLFSRELYLQHMADFELDTDQSLDAYSYGQKKKYLLAFGLASTCRLMLLDEPTNGLDIPSKRQLRKALAAAMTPDRTFIISTHQARDLEHLIDPVVILDSGRIIFNHPMDAISTHLAVHRRTLPPSPDTALYVENLLDGYLVVSENMDQEGSSIDLEILFNAVIENHDRISDILDQGGAS